MALGRFGLTANGGSSDLSITTAGTFICTPVIGLTGMQSLGLWYRFIYGGGGSSVRAYKQISKDGGNTWADIACRLFTTENAVGMLNFCATTPRLTEVVPTDGALTDNTAIDGILGDQSRYKIVVVGTYSAGTLFAARMIAR